MAYPGSLPSFTAVTGSDHPKAEHYNMRARVVEQLAQVIGTSVRTITPLSYVPRKPQNIAQVLDAYATIVKTLTGAANWYSANVPLRCFIMGHGGGATVGAGATTFVSLFNSGLNATESGLQIPVPYAGYAGTHNGMRVELLTAQPASGSLVFTLRKNGVDTALTFTLAASTGAGIYGQANTVTFAAGDKLSVKIVNNASGASAQIGSVSLDYNQNG